jgi:hypothetical protein
MGQIRPLDADGRRMHITKQVHSSDLPMWIWVVATVGFLAGLSDGLIGGVINGVMWLLIAVAIWWLVSGKKNAEEAKGSVEQQPRP